MTPRGARWNALWRRLGAKPGDEALHELEAAYASPGRHYHTLGHLDAVLATFDQLKHLASNPDVAELALWLHDVVWEPMRDDCEQRSVEWAMAHLPALPALPELSALILETRHLAVPSVDPDAAVVRDADLAILAAEPGVFDAYEAGVRAEYSMVPEDQFRVGRAKVLSGFADRRPLFFTPVMQARDGQARANLARSLSALED